MFYTMYTDPLSCALVVYRMSKIERLYKFVKVVVVSKATESSQRTLQSHKSDKFSQVVFPFTTKVQYFIQKTSNWKRDQEFSCHKKCRSPLQRRTRAHKNS